MAQGENRSLGVEGRDDMCVIGNLLRRHEIEHSSLEIKYYNQPEEGVSDVPALVRGMKTAIMTSVGRSVGFGLDADTAPNYRWRAVLKWVLACGQARPSELPDDILVVEATVFGTLVGIWLMGNNQRSGALEDFQTDVIDREDAQVPLARPAPKNAMDIGATASKAHLDKALFHT